MVGMGKIAAVINSKGGVGKTTVTLGLASAAQAAGLTTLVIDIDPQADATWALRPEEIEGGRTAGDVLLAAKAGAAADAIHPTGWGLEVDVLPAGTDLAERDIDRPRAHDARLRLGMSLEGSLDDYDLVLIDCAPSLGQVTLAGLAAADTVVLVAEPSSFAVRAVAAVEQALTSIETELGRKVPVAGVVLNKVPARGTEAWRQVEELRGLVGKRAVWEPLIPSRVVIAEAMADGTPIHWWGARASDVVPVFDALLKKLRRSLDAPGV